MQALWSGYFTIDWGKSGAEASSKVDRLKYHFVCGCGKPGCQACINRPEPLGCELNCMLCQFDPKVAIPYLTGQRKQLQEVLKPLWDRIDLFLEWGALKIASRIWRYAAWPGNSKCCCVYVPLPAST